MANINAPAGSLDRVFGVDVPRTVPIDYFVTLTSTYSSSTGYSWIELRGSPGDGFATPTAALEGDQAYEVTGRTDLAVGSICRMFIDRDQTIYGLIVLREGTSGDCTGCGWLAGMGASRCLRVTAAGVLTDLYLTSDDGNTWTSDDLLTICSVDYTVSVSRDAGGAPQLTLTESGSGGSSYTGQWNCCGCSYAKWTFNLQTICPDETDTGSPCTNVVEVRVDGVTCPTYYGNACCDAASNPPFPFDSGNVSVPPSTTIAQYYTWTTLAAGNYDVLMTDWSLFDWVGDGRPYFNIWTGPDCAHLTNICGSNVSGCANIPIADGDLLCVEVVGTTTSTTGAYYRFTVTFS